LLGYCSTNGVSTPTTPKIPQCLRGRERCHSRCGSHPSRNDPLLPGKRCSIGWCHSHGWWHSRGSEGRSSGSVAVFLILDPQPASAGRGCAVSELDGFGSRSTDGSIVGSTVSDVGVCHVVSDRFQDRQQLVASGGTVEQGEGEVAGHRSVGGVFFGIVADGVPPRRPHRGLPSSH